MRLYPSLAPAVYHINMWVEQYFLLNIYPLFYFAYVTETSSVISTIKL